MAKFPTLRAASLKRSVSELKRIPHPPNKLHYSRLRARAWSCFFLYRTNKSSLNHSPFLNSAVCLPKKGSRQRSLLTVNCTADRCKIVHRITERRHRNGIISWGEFIILMTDLFSCWLLYCWKSNLD